MGHPDILQTTDTASRTSSLAWEYRMGRWVAKDTTVRRSDGLLCRLTDRPLQDLDSSAAT